MSAKTVSILSGLFLSLLAAFCVGMWSTHKDWWPWQKTDEFRSAVRSFRATGRILPPYTFFRRRPDAANERHVVHDEAAIASGYWLINRFDADRVRYFVDLLDPSGEVLLSVPIDYSLVFDSGNPGEFVHAVAMLPDGSVIASWDTAMGMARFDPCGRVIWSRIDQVYHHSFTAGHEGYWTWQASRWDGGQDQKMVRFNPETGDILESIDLIDDVIGISASNSLALRMPENFSFDRDMGENEKADLFHPNDIEELLPTMAAAFPQFAPGDLLVSMRNIDMLAVIDRRTGEVKWVAYGPWNDQHDPDFNIDGTITVFSNNMDRFRSNIIRLDPRTGRTEDALLGTGLDFFSFIMGAHQILPNGNWMITSSMQGRVMEVTPEGRIVREYNNLIDETHNALVPFAEFLPFDYLTSVPTCAK